MKSKNYPMTADEAANSKAPLKGEDIENALNILKETKEKNGSIPSNGTKIKVAGEETNFDGKTLRISKSVYVNGRSKTYAAGTAWEAIDAFGKKNIVFSASDFN